MDEWEKAEVAEPRPVGRQVDGGWAKLMPDVDRRRAWLLTVDGAPQSYVDLDEPEHLEFEYARRLGHVADVLPPGPLDVLHLGGGALTLPRYVAATRPGSRQRVVEADGPLVALIHEELPLPPGSGVSVDRDDARRHLDGAPSASADLVVGDVFRGSRVPAALTTLSCVREVARVLRPDGVYAANLADQAPFTFLGTQIAAFSRCFAHLALVAEPAVLRGRRFGNVVLVGSHAPFPYEELARRTAGDPFPARVEQDAVVRALAGGAEPVDETAAVDSPEPPGGTFRVGA